MPQAKRQNAQTETVSPQDSDETSAQPPRLEKINDAARRMCMSATQVYRLLKSGELQGGVVKLGGRATAVRSDSVDAWVKARLAEAAQPQGKTLLVLSAIHKLEDANVKGIVESRGVLTHDEQEVMDEGFAIGRRQKIIPPPRSGYSFVPFLLYGVWIYMYYSADGSLSLRSEHTGNCLLRGPELS